MHCGYGGFMQTPVDSVDNGSTLVKMLSTSFVPCVNHIHNTFPQIHSAYYYYYEVLFI